MDLACLKEVSGTTRFVATAGSRSTNGEEHRADRDLIRADDEADKPEHQRSRSNTPARFAKLRHSFCTSGKGAVAAGVFAIMTIQYPAKSWGRSVRTTSRRRRRARFRTTAPPTRREVI